MATAAEMLAAAETAYQEALAGRSTRFNGRQWESHEIDKLLEQVKYWKTQASIEASRAAGLPARPPLRFNL